MDVLDSNPLWVRIPVYVGLLQEVDPDAEASVFQAGAGEAGEGYPAVAITGPPTADPGTASADLYYRVPNPDGALRAGERVSVRIPLKGAEAVETVVPWSAVLLDIHGGTWVYEVVEDHVYSRQRVEVRDVVGGFALLSRGPPPGTPVVVVGAAELYSTEFGTAH